MGVIASPTSMTVLKDSFQSSYLFDACPERDDLCCSIPTAITSLPPSMAASYRDSYLRPNPSGTSPPESKSLFKTQQLNRWPNGLSESHRRGRSRPSRSSFDVSSIREAAERINREGAGGERSATRGEAVAVGED